MDKQEAASNITFLRSCKKESDTPIEGELTGEIPKWLKGNLIRVGSGLLEVGPDRYNHLFDGLALMHQFSFKNGKVTYMNKFLRSDTYRKNMKANRILVSEFGTTGIPDPCKTIFQRFSSLFNFDEMTDNDLVTITLYANEVFACSETNFIWKIDPKTLESVEKAKFSNFVPVNAAIAHAHEGKDGTVYNVGSTYGFRPYYKILKIPPKENKNDKPLQNASVICSIPSSRIFNIGYHHSFGMTENYFILVEQPLYLPMHKFLWAHFLGGNTYAGALYWDDSQPTRFHIIRREDGKLLDTAYTAKSFFVFHHINAYEEDNHIVVDMCTYESGEIVRCLYVKALEELFDNQKPFRFDSRAERYVLPLVVDNENKKDDANWVTLPNTTSTAHKVENNTFFCTPESLTGTESWGAELPRINYEKFNEKKYKYFYAIAKKAESQDSHLIKGDVETKQTISWSEEGVIPSEPVYISQPDATSEDEDSGVILASLLYANDESKVSMLVLNAKSMQEIGRVTFITKSSVPGDFHGTFITNV